MNVAERVDSLDLRRRLAVRRAAVPDEVRTAAFLVLLVLVSAVLRTRVLDAPFWIDEGISVGIASHPLSELTGLLRQDGSPPLYYALLHGWIALVGSGEEATHALSLVFALLAVPAAFWAAGSASGRRAAWTCAALAALNPFLTTYAQETRMYTLVALLSIVATGAFVQAFVRGRRRYVPVLALALALLLLTHYWALFFAAGLVAALAVTLARGSEPPRPLRDAGLVLGGAALAFAPWLPTLLYQVEHTGAPWSRAPGGSALLDGPAAVFSGDGSAMALLLAGGSGLAVVLRGAHTRERAAVVGTIVLAASTLLLAWVGSQLAPAWANRYLAVLIGPLLLLAAIGLARAGRLGVVGLVVVLVLWGAYRASDDKSNADEVAAQVAATLRAGDVVVSTHPEQVPVLAYYLPSGLRYATALGPVPDPLVMDWRDALARLEAAKPRETAEELVDRLPVGGRLLLVQPIIRAPQLAETARGWEAPWTSLVRRRSLEWGTLLARDRRLVRVAVTLLTEETFKDVRGTIYRKVRP